MECADDVDCGNIGNSLELVLHGIMQKKVDVEQVCLELLWDLSVLQDEIHIYGGDGLYTSQFFFCHELSGLKEMGITINLLLPCGDIKIHVLSFATIFVILICISAKP